MAAGTNKRELLISALSFTIFATRCLFDFFAAFDGFGELFRHEISEAPDTGVKLLRGSTFALLLLWEVTDLSFAVLACAALTYHDLMFASRL